MAGRSAPHHAGRGRWCRFAILLQVWLVGALPGLALAGDAALDVALADQAPVTLTTHFEALEDADGTLTFDTVRQPEVAARFKGGLPPGESVSFGYTRSAFWLRVTLQNAGRQPVSRMLEIGYPRLSSIQFYQPGADGSYRLVDTGGVKPFAERPYKNRNFVFPFVVPAQSEQTYYLRVQAISSILIPARLWEPEAFHAHERNDYLGQAWYFGMVSAMALFNLLLFVALRDIVYLLYVNFISIGALSIASQNGLGKEFLWHNAPQWSDISTTVIYSWALSALFLFMRHMLNSSIVIPRFDRVLKAITMFFLIYPLSFFFIPQVLIKATAMIYFAAMALVLGTGIYCAAVKRQRSAVFFVAAFALLMCGGLMTALRLLGILPANLLTLNGLQVGSALEMVMLAFALADRFNEIRRERAKAQKDALEAQIRLVNGLKTSERLLEERVQRRTEALSKSNSALNEAYKVAEAARQQATDALEDLRKAQAQLVQSEKMASLGQLVANVAHEINTPIGAVKSSGKNIADALDYALQHMPEVFRKVDADTLDLFMRLIGRANRPRAVMTTREERTLTREVTRELTDAGIAEAHHKAEILVQMGAQLAVNSYLPLLRHEDCDMILETAYNLAKIINNTGNINVAVDRVSKIIFALKNFSRADDNGRRVETRLDECLDTVLTIYQSQIRQGTEVIRQCEVIPPLRCVPDEINQLWTNLIHNALAAMNNKGLLTLGIRKVGNEAILTVGDTGCGIPEEIRDRIFDAFFTTKPAGEGSGLGLDIVKRIVDRHGGRIELDSTIGVGSTFRVHLPYPPETQ